MSESDAPALAPKAILAGHGAFAEGALSAVAQITGLQDRFIAFSNVGLGPGEIEARLRETLDATGARLIFTDLPAGSCTIAARRIAKDRPDVVVVTGVALPTLLSFACGSDVQAAVEQGRKALNVLEVPRGA